MGFVSLHSRQNRFLFSDAFSKRASSPTRPFFYLALIALFSVGCAEDVAQQGMTAGIESATLNSAVLQMRQASTQSVFGSFRVEPGYFSSGASPTLSDKGAIALTLNLSESGKNAIWLGDSQSEAPGSIVYFSPVDAFLGQATINQFGHLAFEELFSVKPGIYATDVNTPALISHATDLPLGFDSRTALFLTNKDTLLLRARIGDVLSLMHIDPKAKAEAPLLSASVSPIAPPSQTGDDNFSWLFAPSFNQQFQFALQVRTGPEQNQSQPDQILFFDGQKKTFIAADRDHTDSSPFVAFDAPQFGLSENGNISFIAKTNDGTRGVYRYRSGNIVLIAKEQSPDFPDEPTAVGSLDYFSTDVNDDGWVVFRGKNLDGESTIWRGNGIALVPVATAGDLVYTDLGPAVFASPLSSSAVFLAAPVINNLGQVAFLSQLVDAAASQTSFGVGLFTATL